MIVADNDDLAEAVAAVAATDPQIQAAVRQLAIMAVRKTHHYLRNGSPQVQLQILRSFIPALIREMGKTGDNDEYAQLKAEMESLRREMFAEMGGEDAEDEG